MKHLFSAVAFAALLLTLSSCSSPTQTAQGDVDTLARDSSAIVIGHVRVQQKEAGVTVSTFEVESSLDNSELGGRSTRQPPRISDGASLTIAHEDDSTARQLQVGVDYLLFLVADGESETESIRYTISANGDAIYVRQGAEYRLATDATDLPQRINIATG